MSASPPERGSEIVLLVAFLSFWMAMLLRTREERLTVSEKVRFSTPPSRSSRTSLISGADVSGMKEAT